jgi:chemotaxis protein methyltransferase CheR
MGELALSPQVFSILAALLEERTGLRYTSDDAVLFADKVGARALEAGFDSLLDYYYFLRYDAEGARELDQLVEALVVHETYFFRELESLEVVIDEFIVPAVERNGSARVWSAACATGEEPLTVAMLLEARGLLDRVEIVASDISELSLERARSGRYRPRSLRQDGLALADRFIRREGGELVVDRRLIGAVSLRRVNLCDHASVARLQEFDLILCRNVLIYFSDRVIGQVAGELYQALRPGGCVLVGVSESLLRFSTELVCEEKRGVFVYRRPG